jgi:hypothetical protein
MLRIVVRCSRVPSIEALVGSEQLELYLVIPGTVMESSGRKMAGQMPRSKNVVENFTQIRSVSS